LVNSGKYDGLPSSEAKNNILWDLETGQTARKVVCFKLRDWLFSRQRYWGEPFPIIWVSEEGYQKILQSKASPFKEFLPQSAITYRADGQAFYAIPLASEHLPLKLPEIQSYQPSGTADSPLANAKHWVNVALNVTTGEIVPQEELQVKTNDWILGTRETNTMPQWAGSCWYYLRYLSPKEGKAFVNKDAERYWGTPDFYIGGAEHAVLHLLYARFWHQFLYDIGEVSTPEPFKKLFHQGIIVDAEGNKMSKSRGNVVNPDDIVKTHGADALRLYELFLGPLEAMKPWNTQSIEGVSRFLKKVWRLFVTDSAETHSKMKHGIANSAETDTILHETILKVTEAIDNLRFNTGISQLMICLNHLQSCDEFSWETGEIFLQLLAPLAPHIAEELWHRLGHPESICLKPWPKADLAKIASDEMTIVLQINGKMRGNFSVAKTTSQECVIELAKSQEKAAQALANGRLIKAIYVPGKLVNLVIQ
jgi:leucyl-tRNA synthetase